MNIESFFLRTLSRCNHLPQQDLSARDCLTPRRKARQGTSFQDLSAFAPLRELLFFIGEWIWEPGMKLGGVGRT